MEDTNNVIEPCNGDPDKCDPTNCTNRICKSIEIVEDSVGLSYFQTWANLAQESSYEET